MKPYIKTVRDVAEEHAQNIFSLYLDEFVNAKNQGEICGILARCFGEALRVEPALLPGIADGLAAGFTPLIELGVGALLKQPAINPDFAEDFE